MASDFLYEHRIKARIAIVIVVLAGAVVFVSLRAVDLDKKATLYEEQAASMSLRLAAFENQAQESELPLKPPDEISSLRSKVQTLEAINKELATVNEELIADFDSLEEHAAGLLAETQWLKEAEQRKQPEEKFKITFYSTPAEYEHLVPGETVAMNAQQVEDLGLKKGDEIYVISNKGWSGFYKITDHGCAYGTIDIYVAPGEIPSYGVEYDVEILI